jgi:hypothetical protein
VFCAFFIGEGGVVTILEDIKTGHFSSAEKRTFLLGVDRVAGFIMYRIV